MAAGAASGCTYFDCRVFNDFNVEIRTHTNDLTHPAVAVVWVKVVAVAGRWGGGGDFRSRQRAADRGVRVDVCRLQY